MMSEQGDSMKMPGFTRLAYASGKDWAVGLMMADDPRAELPYCVVSREGCGGHRNQEEVFRFRYGSALKTEAKRFFEQLVEDHVRRRYAELMGKWESQVRVAYSEGYFKIEAA